MDQSGKAFKLKFLQFPFQNKLKHFPLIKESNKKCIGLFSGFGGVTKVVL